MIKKYLIFILLFYYTSFPQGYVYAIGGGSEDYNDWSDPPYSWIVDKCDSGKIIILSYGDATSWLPNYFSSLGASEVYNKKIAIRSEAELQETYDELITAKAIFLRGGDQWKYIDLWKGTKTEEAILYVFNSGGVVAGTSAGLAVLGEIDYSAQFSSVNPRSALLNPLMNSLTLEDNFLKLTPNVIFDSHFIERGRAGRLIAMLYKLKVETGRDVIGCGVDDRTAVCINPTGKGTVMGSGAASIFYADKKTEYINSPFYTINNLKCDQLTSRWQFDFINKEISFIPSSAVQFESENDSINIAHNIWLTGDDNISSSVDGELTDFLNENPSGNIIIFSHEGFSNSAAVIEDKINSVGRNFLTIFINDFSLNSISNSSAVENSSQFIFAGDSLSVLSKLADTSYAVSKTFNQKKSEKINALFFGKAGKIAGKNFVDNIESGIYNSYRGRMTNERGLNLADELIFQPKVYEDSDYYENRVSALLWGMMRNRKKIGIYLDNSSSLSISDNKINFNSVTPLIVVDASETTFADSSTYRASGSIGPRQVVAMDNLRYSLSKNSDLKYDINSGRFLTVTAIEDELQKAESLYLFQNYPNPFNPLTTIKYAIPTVETGYIPSVRLIVYDLLGKEIAVLVDDFKPAGFYEYEFNSADLSSGVYFYRLTINNFSKTKSMIILK